LGEEEEEVGEEEVEEEGVEEEVVEEVVLVSCVFLARHQLHLKQLEFLAYSIRLRSLFGCEQWRFTTVPHPIYMLYYYL
jgi:hypothetical protein